MAEPRFPARVYSVGDEPDPRFSLANERTFLAWIRTSLALLAGGVALEALQLPVQPGFRLAAAVLFVVLALVSCAQAWWGWMATERAMREGRALPGPTSGPALVAGIAVAVVLLTLGLLLG